MEKIKNILANLIPSRDGAIGKTYSLINKIILMSFVLLAIIWYKFDFVASLLIDNQDIKIAIEKALFDATGKQSTVEGEINFVTSPQPQIVVNKINVQNEEGSNKESFLQIDTLKTSPDLFSLVLGKIKFDKIELENVSINHDEKTNNPEIKQNIFSELKTFEDKNIIIKNIEIHNYKKSLKSNNIIDSKYFFSALEFSSNQEGAKGPVIKGALYNEDTKDNLIFLIDFEDGLNTQSSLSARVYSDDIELNITGNINTTENLSFDININGKVKNFSKKLFQLSGISSKISDAIKDGEETSFSSKITLSDSILNISETKAESNLISLNANSQTEFSKRTNNKINIDISKFNYAQAFKTSAEIASVKKITKIQQDFQTRLNNFFLFSLGDYIDFDLNFNVNSISFSDGTNGKINLKAHYLESKFTLEKFVIILPGESGVTTAALITVDPATKTMKGSMAFKAIGKNLDNFLLGINLSDNNKQKKLGEFQFEGKAYLYEKTIHLREFTGKIDDNLVAGQIIVDYSKEFAAQAAFNFNKLELDKFISADDSDSEFVDDSFAGKLDVIRYFDSIFDHLSISVNSDNLTKTGEKLKDFSIFAKISPGICEVKEFFFNTTTTGNVSGTAFFDVTDFQPKAKFNIKLEKFDFDLLAFGKLVPENDNYNFDGKWPEYKISFEKLSSFDGEINLQADKFKFYHLNFDNFRIAMETAGGKTKIKEARLDKFGTKIDIEGQLVNDYAAFDLNFIATNIDIPAFMFDTFGFKTIAGKFNATGSLSSTGFSMKEMVKNLRGKFSIVSRGVVVSGFDVVQLAANMPKIKRIEQSEAAGKYFLNRGTTEFGGISGYLKIAAGVINFSDIALSNPVLRNTALNGSIDLNNWSMNLDSNMGIISDDKIQVNIPLKNISQNLPETQLNWDYNGIVKYWENKFYGGSY